MMEAAVALSRQQRRALREIEEHLAAEDPALADLLRRAEGTRHERVIRGVTGGSVTAAVTVLLLGLVLIDAGVPSGWAADSGDLPVCPVLVCLVAGVGDVGPVTGERHGLLLISRLSRPLWCP